MADADDIAVLDGRQRLIRTALVLFADRGVNSVSVRDIAKASAVSIGLINHHFGSKDGLRVAVDEYFMQQFEEGIGEAIERRGENLDDYSNWLDDWIARHKKDWPTTVKYFRRAMLEESEWGESLFSRFYALIQSWVTKSDANGDIADDVDRLWLPFLIMFLELGTMLLDPYIERAIGQSGFETELWRRRHRAYTMMITRGIAPQVQPAKR
jgi:AcrR family transcriptional regulator